MGKIESLKIILELIKTLIAIMITAFFGILGYLVLHYKTLDSVAYAFMGIGVVILIAMLYFCVVIFIKKFKELEALK